MQHNVILSVTHPLTTNVTQFSVVRYTGAYTTDSPVLGVALEAGNSGEYGAIAVQGVLPVKIAEGETLNVGDLLGLDAAGNGVAPASGSKVSDFTTVFKIVKNYALVII